VKVTHAVRFANPQPNRVMRVFLIKFGSGLAKFVLIVLILIPFGMQWRISSESFFVNKFSRKFFDVRADKLNSTSIDSLLKRARSHTFEMINMTVLALADRLFEVPDNLWPPTRALMVNSTNDLRWKILNKKKIYITYGENCCQSSLSRACHAALSKAAMDDCRALNSKTLDSDFREKNSKILSQKKGAGLWLWKPYIINKTLHEMADGEYLVYADAGAYFNGPIHPLLVLLERLDASYGGVLVFGVGTAQRSFCKRDAFVRQRCDTPACHDARQVNGALSIWRRGAHALRVVEAWLRDCQDYQVRTQPRITWVALPCSTA
jgi:hypothetical protein